jgi:endo-1,4-beta-xylanase
MLNTMIRNTFITALAFAIAACGGGGGGGTKSSTPASSKVALSSSSASSVVASSVASSTLGIKNTAPANLPIGVAIRIGYLGDTTNHAIVEKHFSEIVLENEMKMEYLEPTNNSFTFGTADSYATYANTNGMTFHGHVLVWHSQIPAFMESFSGLPSAYQALLSNHVTKVAAHFSGKVKSWDVVNEALDDGQGVGGGYRDSVHYKNSGNSISFITQAFVDARNADATADLYYADYNIEPNNSKRTTLMKLLGVLKTANAPINGVSFQMHVYQDYPSISDMKSAWKAVVDLGLKVKITELDVAVNNPYSGQNPWFKVTSFTPAAAQNQKVRYCQIIEAYLATVPESKRGGITVWGVRDSETWLLQQNAWMGNPEWPLLFDASGAEKPAVDGVRDALQSKSCM